MPHIGVQWDIRKKALSSGLFLKQNEILSQKIIFINDMCGFAGLININNYSRNEMARIVKSMGDEIAHRGPDDSGEWIDESSKIAFAHRRLSILDLSKAGHQPMFSSSNRYILVFNGEIYNHLEIRKEIEKKCKKNILWIGHSDTETLLHSIEIFGIHKTLQKLSGMFAIAVWDQKLNKLTIARDRFGEKPLYYGWIGQTFIFCSELKSIKKYPNFKNTIDRMALKEYLQYCYVPAPKTIYQDIFKLLPGNYIEINIFGDEIQLSKTIEYWSLKNLIIHQQSNLINNENKNITNVERALEKSVKSQMISDVPLGAFLSGGVDSSLIVALMQKQSMSAIKTFTIGFNDGIFNYIGDESPFAKAVAEYLGTDHTELILESKDAQDIIPKLTEMYDEPFADSSQIPTHLVAKLARQHVTVALSGDGGDELFGGYNRYALAPKFWRTFSKIPFRYRKIIGSAINSISLRNWIFLSSMVGSISLKNDLSKYGEKFFKLGKRLKNIETEEDLFISMISQWHSNEIFADSNDNFNNSSIRPRAFFKELDDKIEKVDFASKMMFVDSLTYLPDDILCKVDRAAMSVSLETRIPFLDEEVCKAAWQAPAHLKFNKQLLRKALYRYLPRDLVDRPKEGFGIPLGKWLRGPLKNWVEDLLDTERIRKEGYFSPVYIDKIWKEHQENKVDWSHQLWTILMFQSWLNDNKK